MNARNLLLVLANLPFALVGGILAVFAGGGMLSLGAMVGFVTLFGITVRNSIMLISHYEHLVSIEGREWGYRTAIDGASERLIPILMTALVTALGLLPLGDRKQCTRTGNRRSAGYCHSRRFSYFNSTQLAGATNTGTAFRTI